MVLASIYIPIACMLKTTTRTIAFKIIAAVILLCFIQLSLPLPSYARAPVKAQRAMVVTSHRLASEVGLGVMRDGGNAVDAAVAAAFALAVVLPSAGNIGGGGFMLYMDTGGKATTFDFREKAPMGATADMFLDSVGGIKDRSNHEGGLSVGVPGTVAGLLLARERLGSKPLSRLIQPAIELAENGFPVSFALHADMKAYATEFKKYPSTAKAFLKNGIHTYRPGEIWKQPELANTLRLIKKRGKEGFYTGRNAELIVKTVEKYGGIITLDDLASYEAIEREPVQGTYRGYSIYSMGPPSSGGVVLIEMLNILEGYDIKQFGHNSTLYMHALTEAMRLAYLDRARYMGGPDYNPALHLEKLLSKAYAKKLRGKISLTRAGVSAVLDVRFVTEGQHTTHISVLDPMGNAVSLTYTIERRYGSKIVVEGAGFLLNNEMGDFNPVPGETNESGRIGTPPNLAAPGKRMLSSMTPTIVAKDGNAVLVVGTPGGRTIINTVLQVILNVIDHGMNIATAVEAGRFHHQWFPDSTFIEKWATTIDSLKIYRSLGHAVEFSKRQGQVMAILVDHKSGVIQGAADGRSPDGAALGY